MSMFRAGFFTEVSIFGMLVTSFLLPGTLRAASGMAKGNKSLKPKSLSVKKKKDIRRKLKEIIIDHIEFEEVSIPTVFKYLKQRSKQLDPGKEGVNFVLISDKSDVSKKKVTGATVTMVVDDIPLGQAIQYICRAANLKYRIDDYAVVVAPHQVPFESLETRIYPVEQQAVTEVTRGKNVQNIQSYFERRGVAFPKGSKIIYDEQINRLIVTNTPAYLAMIEGIIRRISVIDPMVLVEAKLVRISQKDLEKIKRKHSKKARSVWSAVVASESAQVIASSAITTLNGQEAEIRMVTERYFPNSWNLPGKAKKTKTGDKNSKNANTSLMPRFNLPTELGTVFRITPNVDSDHYTISFDANLVVKSFIGWGSDISKINSLNKYIKMPKLKSWMPVSTVKLYDGDTILVSEDILESGDSTSEKKASQTKRKVHILFLISAYLINPDGTTIREHNRDITNRHLIFNAPIVKVIPVPSSGVRSSPRQYSSELEKKLTAINMDVNFDDASINSVLTYLNEKSKQFDSDKTGVHVIINATLPIGGVPKITLDLTAIPVGEIIRYICLQTGLKHRKESRAVIIGDENIIELNTCFFNVSTELSKLLPISKNKDGNTALKTYFSDRGVTFPDNATIAYDRHAQKLIVKNTVENLRRIERLLRELDVQTPLITIEAKIVEISQAALKELLNRKGKTFLINRILNSKKAKILASPKVTTQSGSTAVCNMFKEESFPKSWTDPQVSVKGNEIKTTPSCPVFGKPTAVGSRLEVTPTVSPNNYTVSINVNSEIVGLKGWTEYGYEIYPLDEKKTKCIKEKLKMPDFSQKSITTNIKTYDGETIMIGRMQRNSSFKNLFDCDSKSNENEIKNIYIFLTARLVSPDGVPIRSSQSDTE